jgi:hypothetical protein
MPNPSMKLTLCLTRRSLRSSNSMFALIFAPGFGGGLSEFGLSVPFFTSAALALVGGLTAIVYLKESMPNPRPFCGQAVTNGKEDKRPAQTVDEAAPKNEEGEGENSNEPTDPVEVAQARILATLFACGALLNFGFRIFIMMGPLWVYKKFGWGAATYGFVTSGVGCFGIFVK